MLEKKVVIVTGAAGLIGSTIARAIVEQHGQVVIADVAEKKGKSIAMELGGDNYAIFVPTDITQPDALDRLIKMTDSHFGKIDAAVHLAYPRSIGWGTCFEDLKPNYLAEDLFSQLGGAILFSKSIMEYSLKQGYGNLIHASSIQGFATPKFDHYQGTDMTSPIEYSAIKSGVISITKWLAKYHKNSNIRVNCISPGGILDQQPASFLEKYRESCTSKGMLGAEDVVGTVLFLLSEKSKYINGQNIVIDDGWSL
jgi:NAD(P)-dependent dehydrogenase (short-subunit alcohol dehydrogenase family)